MPEGQGEGGAAFSKGTSDTVLYVLSLPPTLQTYCQTVKHFNKAKVLSEWHKH